MKGYFTGPGGWLYYVYGGGVLVVWSPTARREINTGLDAAASKRVIAELSVSGRYLGTNKAAALLAVQGGGASTATAGTGITAYLSTMPDATPGTPTTTTTPAPGMTTDTGTKITDQPWFIPAVVGGLGLLAVLAFTKPSKAKAPSSRYAGLF
jgi:hypothetical protein